MNRASGWQNTAAFTGQTGWARPSSLLTQRALRIHLGDLPFSTTNQPPAGGFQWFFTVSSLSGWWEPAPDATDAVGHWSGDGTVPLMDRLGPRRIDLRGLIHSKGMLHTIAAKDALSRIRRAQFTVEERAPGTSRLVEVRRVDLQYTDVYPHLSRYQLTLVADDPLRYGTASHTLTNGSNQLTNRGDAAAFPLLELRGPHNAVTITHPGGSFSFPSLSSSQRRLIDARNGDVWNLANDQRVFVGSGPWPRVAEGGSSWQVSGLGSGTAVVRRFEAWT